MVRRTGLGAFSRTRSRTAAASRRLQFRLAEGFGRSQLAAEARSLHRVAPALTRRRAIQGAGDKCSPALEERQSRAWQAPTDAERMAARSPSLSIQADGLVGRPPPQW